MTSGLPTGCRGWSVRRRRRPRSCCCREPSSRSSCRRDGEVPGVGAAHGREVTLTGEPVMFVSVKLAGCLGPHGLAAEADVAGGQARLNGCPIPDRGTVWGLGLSLAFTTSEAERVPAADGLNRMVRLQLAWLASVAGSRRDDGVVARVGARERRAVEGDRAAAGVRQRHAHVGRRVEGACRT